jgi:hypothetical protein
MTADAAAARRPAAEMSVITPSPAVNRSADHRNPVTTSHLPGGEPEGQVRPSTIEKEKPMTSVFSVVSAEVAP